jgi:NitT/TauT family transport system permease protein
MLRRPISWRWHVFLGVVSFATLAFFYTLWYRQRQIDDPEDRVLPSWERMYKEGVLSALSERDPKDKGLILWKDLGATFSRLANGMALSIAIALPLGVLMGCYAPIEAFVLPPLAFLAKIPGTAMLGVFYIMPGIGLSERFFTAMIVFGIIPTMTQTIYHAAKEDVPEESLFKARTLGASQAECICYVVFMHILPKVLEAFRLSIGPALIFLFASETIYGDEGLGRRIRLQSAKGIERYPIVFFYLACAGLFGLTIDSALRWLRRVLCPWYVQ